MPKKIVGGCKMTYFHPFWGVGREDYPCYNTHKNVFMEVFKTLLKIKIVCAMDHKKSLLMQFDNSNLLPLDLDLNNVNDLLEI